MTQGQRQALISCTTLLVVFVLLWLAYRGMSRAVVAMQPVPPAVRYKTTLPPSVGPAYTHAQTLQFLIAAQTAESIVDPLKRCLAYPDPPGSHWNRAEVVAYCKYRNQKLLTFAQAQQLIEAGKAAELDKLLAQALHAQMTNPDAAGLLDRMYYTAFHNGSFDIRPTLDAWKRQSPDSAFAYAASGLAYKEMAFKARGGKWLTETPNNQLASMDRLVTLADADLQHAQKLDPKVTPIYSTMIALGGMTLGSDYGRTAARRGLAVAPGNLAIYDQWMWMEEPKWGGSLETMAAVAREAQQHASTYPLLGLESQAVDLYRVNNCRCSSDQQLAAYASMADHLLGWRDLQDAGYAAKDAHSAEATAIFFSEALRFNPGLDDVRTDRMSALVWFHHDEWAVEEGNQLLAHSPDNEDATKARGWAYLAMHDLPQAQKDFETAIRLDPTDMWALSRLGDVYVGTGQWDKAWAAADQLIAANATRDDGWLLRAKVQAWQPRPGLDKTTEYIATHFGDDKQDSEFVSFLRTLLKSRAANPGKSNAEVLTAVMTEWRARQEKAAATAAGKAAPRG